jgi:hypothetical protein
MRDAEQAVQKPRPRRIPPKPSRLNGAGAQEGATASELIELLHGLEAMRVGDFSARMSRGGPGLLGKIADVFNEIGATNQRMARELDRLGQVVGREGRTRLRADPTRRIWVPSCSTGTGCSSSRTRRSSLP